MDPVDDRVRDPAEEPQPVLVAAIRDATVRFVIGAVVQWVGPGFGQFAGQLNIRGEPLMAAPTGPGAGHRPNSERVLIDARLLQGPGAGRGEGTYARGLLGGLLEEGFQDRALLLLDADLEAPVLPGEGWLTTTVRRRYHGRFAAYEDAVALGTDLERIRPAAFHALRLGLPGRSPVPVAVTLHDLIPWAWGGARTLGEKIRHLPGKRLLRSADLVLAVSESSAADARRFARVARGRLRVILEGVDPSFRPSSGAAEQVRTRWRLERPYLIYVGALDARKSPADLLRAWETAKAAGAACDLVIAGSPGAQAPPSLPGARLLGPVSREELVDLLSAAACLVFPSRYEGFGLPVLEAMACGTPAIAYSNSSLPEVAGDVGILVRDGDAETMGRKAAELIADPELADRVRSAGLRHAAGFTWRRAAVEVIAAYAKLLP